MKSLSLASTLLCLVSTVAAADLVITVEHKDLEQSPPVVESGEMVLGDSVAKMEMTSSTSSGHSEEMSFIYRGDQKDQKRVILVDHSRKSYMVMDKGSMKAVSSQVSNAMKQLEAQMANMPPEQRKMMEQMMQGKLPGGQEPTVAAPVSETRKTDRKATKLGMPCVCWETYVDGTKQAELWVTDWKHAGVKQKAFDVVREMAGFYRELIESMPMARKMMEGGSMFGGIEEVDGFPVLVVEFDGETVTGETAFKSADERKVDPSAYDPPAGYKQQTMGAPGGTR